MILFFWCNSKTNNRIDKYQITFFIYDNTQYSKYFDFFLVIFKRTPNWQTKPTNDQENALLDVFAIPKHATYKPHATTHSRVPTDENSFGSVVYYLMIYERLSVTSPVEIRFIHVNLWPP